VEVLVEKVVVAELGLVVIENQNVQQHQVVGQHHH
jgi:hypothetical protein